MKDVFAGALLGALTLGASAASAAGATITVTHELDGARPAEVIAIPFVRDRHRDARGLRMYHLVVRDAKGHVLPLAGH